MRLATRSGHSPGAGTRMHARPCQQGEAVRGNNRHGNWRKEGHGNGRRKLASFKYNGPFSGLKNLNRFKFSLV